MFTVCPKCSLKLVVTAADLRVAQGYVRCGRCSNVFNALAGLSDEQQAALAQQQARAAVAVPQPIEPAAPAGMTARDDEPIPDTALEFDPATTDVSKVFIVPDPDDQSPTGTFESIVLKTPEPPSAPSEPKPSESLPIEFELDDSVTAEEAAAAVRGSEKPVPAEASTEAPVPAQVNLPLSSPVSPARGSA